MERYHLKTFITVAEEGHLTRAAQRLNTSQPAISAHIKNLEREKEAVVGAAVESVRAVWQR